MIEFIFKGLFFAASCGSIVALCWLAVGMLFGEELTKKKAIRTFTIAFSIAACLLFAFFLLVAGP